MQDRDRGDGLTAYYNMQVEVCRMISEVGGCQYFKMRGYTEGRVVGQDLEILDKRRQRLSLATK